MSDHSIAVEYNKHLGALEDLLSGIKRPGNFFVNGTVEIPMPKVEISGVGILSFPVPPGQIQAVIGQARRAPYGKGEKTIVDTAVRKAWQLPPDKVRLGGRSWAASFDRILKQVVAGLGCQDVAVTAELYKLLVYDAGGFFLSHRDTEKTDRMFATLVIVLPSMHHGGDLVIRHAGREVTVNMCSTEISELVFAAFYADCEHEVRPVTDGNRVCLVYNLIHQWSSKPKGALLHAPQYDEQTAALADLLERHLTVAEATPKIAWLLEHHYSPDGLSLAALKSADAARVKVLLQAAERAGCTAHLGIVHIEESGTAEPTYYDFKPRRRGRYDADGDEDEEPSDSDDFKVIEVYDCRHYIDQWRDSRDRTVEFGEMPLEPGELLPVGALDGEKPDEERLTEATGNEGASFERSYHRAAVVIWRRERHLDVLLQAGVEATLPYLRERVDSCRGKRRGSAPRAEVVSLADRLVKAWIAASKPSGYRQPPRQTKRDVMLALLNQLGEVALLEKFVAECVTRDYDGGENKELAAGAKLLGPTKSGPLFAELMGRRMGQLCGPCIELLHSLAFARATNTTKDWHGALLQISEATVDHLDDVGKKPDRDAWSNWDFKADLPAIDVATVVKLMSVLARLRSRPLADGAVQKLSARPAVFDPVTLLAPALQRLDRRGGGKTHPDPAWEKLWQHSADFVLRRSEYPPKPPADWRQKTKLSCSCPDCLELRAFTRDPVEQTHRFRVRMDRRQHLHQMIERHSLAMTHVTERKGSPQTLVCTKDRRDYERRCQQFDKDIESLAVLLAVKGLSPRANQSIRDRMAAARLRAGKDAR